ncbi:flagellar assembly protein FliH [uncultured Pseudomonas sp.]|uniref:flagellar assembly protein FliH n=1 Tax=uncultured Pseudomonas sp. TaxID=114707 RepID=UPI0025E30669|nr:flagellar assembly protein FliH [uncultured Pseudomonas sp.]
MSKESASELIRARDLEAFDVWRLPAFDSFDEPAQAPAPAPEPEPQPEALIEEVPVEEVQPITLEELEAIRQEAYNEGFVTGERDGYHAGQLKARQEAEAALGTRLASLETLMTHLLDPIGEQDQALEAGMVQLVRHIVREVVQRELKLDSSQLAQVVRTSLKLLPMGAENIRIHVSPQDFDLMKALRDRHEEKWRILEDEALMPGGCRIETESSVIDASIETRLTQALTQLAEQQRQQATQPQDPDLHIDIQEPPHAS